ncbi:MAG: SUMF1/EgtB/PvdO family nonheme iron enzyme [Chitinophagales bacterium]
MLPKPTLLIWQTSFSKNIPTKKGYRLPTEAEWEYAARGGKNGKNTIYSGGDNIEEVAWYYRNSGSRTHPVGAKKENELGLYDMSGNVWEWCFDSYEDYPQDTLITDYFANESGSNRVLRGGSWDDSSGFCRVANRFNGNPYSRYDSYGGFRLAYSL